MASIQQIRKSADRWRLSQGAEGKCTFHFDLGHGSFRTALVDFKCAGPSGPMFKRWKADMRKPILLFLALLSAAQIAHAAVHRLNQPAGWNGFADERYGTRVQYPSRFAIREGRPVLGPGKRLVTPDRRAEIEIYSLPNGIHATPHSYLAAKMSINRKTLHYKRVTSHFFLLSAARRGKIYYTRCNFSRSSAGPIHCVYLGYPQSEKRAWDDIVTRFSAPMNKKGAAGQFRGAGSSVLCEQRESNAAV